MKYVDQRFAGDAPVELIRKSIRRGKLPRVCDGCGFAIVAGVNRMAITGKYNEKITTQYFCGKCCMGTK
jgi:hypothetical protein